MNASQATPCGSKPLALAEIPRAKPGAANLWSAAGSVIAWQNRMPPLLHSGNCEPAPLSLAQERLWSLEQSEPGAAYYHIPLTWEIEGELDLAALQKSFKFLLERHEALRTSFPCAPEGPCQQVNSIPATLQIEDLSTAP